MGEDDILEKIRRWGEFEAGGPRFEIEFDPAVMSMDFAKASGVDAEACGWQGDLVGGRENEGSGLDLSRVV